MQILYFLTNAYHVGSKNGYNKSNKSKDINKSKRIRIDNLLKNIQENHVM